MHRGTAAALVAALTGALLLAGAPLAAAEPPKADPGDPAAVKEFMDHVVPEQLAKLQIPGAAVSVVAGGRQVLGGGYGVADLETRRPVIAERTMFRIDSVSKLLTGTAVMQLVERGALDLDTDVNEYLTAFEIPDTFPGRPVTLANLLTHSAGFAERNVGIDGTTRQPLGAYLAANQPGRIRPPGTLPAYSNYGVALAGHVVELRAGMPFERYVEERILRPLGMASTTFEQSPAHPARAELTRFYRTDGERNVPVDVSIDLMPPAGAAVATATDMSRFMLAHLQGGQLDGARILDPATAEQMHARQFATDPRLPGMSYSFYNEVRKGQHAIAHGGDGLGSHSRLVLFSQQQVGLFVAVNGDGTGIGGSDGVQQLTNLFADHFLPAEPATPKRIAADPATSLAGTYRYTRISTSDPTRIMIGLRGGVAVVANPDGTLTTDGATMSNGPDQQETKRWVPVGERLFQREGGEELLAFGVNERGEGVSFSVSDDATVAWERLQWWQTAGFHTTVTLVSIALLLSTLAWPVLALVRRSRSGAPRLARPLAGLMVALVAAFLGYLAYLVVDFDRFIEAVIRATPALTTLLLLSLAAAVCAAGVVAAAVVAWWREWWTVAGRLHYSLVALAAVAFFAVMWEYHLLAWPLA